MIRSKAATGLRTRKIRRWWCHDCQRAFSQQRQEAQRHIGYELGLILRAAHLYFDREASYRAVGRELHVRPYRIFQWIDALGENAKSFVEVAKELKPSWDGYLLLDGKVIFVQGEHYSLLLSADAATQDVPIASFAPSERAQHWEPMLECLRDEIGYPLKGLVIDGDWGLWSACQKLFPRVPLQLCVRHMGQFLHYHFRYLYKGSGKGVEAFKALAFRLLYVKSQPQRDFWLKIWQQRRQAFKYCGLEKEILSFEDKLPFLFTHLDHPGMPRTTNIIEGIIRQLSRKIDDTDGFESTETAWRSLRLLIMRYRFHRFTDSRLQGHNGKAPLELAGVNIDNIDWVQFSQKKHQ